MMIISASRRTDIPAFHATWFTQQIRAGYCLVPNPFNPSQITQVSLTPPDVDVIVFWTRHPRPLFPYLDELNQRGYSYYFQYTLLNNPRQIDPKTPAVEAAINTFCQLAEQIGPERVIWRYDPIVFSNLTSLDFHRETFASLARRLQGHTQRVVISLMDPYRKLTRRLARLAQQGLTIHTIDNQALQHAPSPWLGEFGDLMHSLVQTASANGMQISSCAETVDLRPYGILPGKCIDDELIKSVFGITVPPQKDASQRAACGCVASKDIGAYNTCLFGCTYCYATSSFAQAREYYARHLA